MVSSASLLRVHSIPSSVSLMKMWNSTSPKTDPCLAPIYRRERRFFEICIPSMRLRNNGPDVGPNSLLKILKREMGKGRMDTIRIGVMEKGRRAIEKIGRSRNCIKRG